MIGSLSSKNQEVDQTEGPPLPLTTVVVSTTPKYEQREKKKEIEGEKMEVNKKLKVQYTETTKQVNTKETLEM